MHIPTLGHLLVGGHSLVSVLVVPCPTRVVVAESKVIVPVFEIVDITSTIKVLFVSICTVAAPTI
jgi:hypothetical protein